MNKYREKYYRLIFYLFILVSVKNLPAQTFVDLALSQGIIHTLNSDIGIGGSGVSFFDFDNDGWDDITFIQINDSIVFYKNVNGTFELIPSFIYGPGENKQLLWVDYDNDGDNDAFLTAYGQPCRLFNNDGEFNFSDVTAEAGLFGLNSNNYGVNFADYDKDGYLDFYLSRYYNTPQDPLNPLYTNALYRNNGNGTFTNVTLTAGVDNGIQPTFMGVWIDVNHDSWPDLYVINDRVLWGNSLYLNNGDGTFLDITESSGAAMFGEDPMGATYGDFDNDGDLDILCTNGGPPTKPIRVYVNQGDNTFIENGQQLGIHVNITFHCTWGATWIDVDNDTFQDVYVTTGLLTTDASNEKRSFLFMSDSANVFVDSQQMFLNDHLAASYAVAKGDINNDGFADLVVQNAKNFNSFIWLNQVDPLESNSFVKVTLEGTVSNKMAIGCWITVFANGTQHTHYTRCGENFVSQDSQHHIFGLGSASLIDSLVVEYPSGHVDRYYDLSVNQNYFLKEGETYHAQISVDETIFCQGDSIQLFAGFHNEVNWNTGSTDFEINVTESGFYWFVAQNEFGITTQSDTVFIEVLPLPEISVNTQNPLCAGDENGLIYIFNEFGIGALSISWNNGMEGDSLINLPAGNYFYEYIDLNGCSQSGIAQLQEPEELLLQVFVTADFGQGDGTIFLIVNGGTPPYTVYLNGDLGVILNENLSSGIYDILVVDSNGCSESTTATIDNLTANHFNPSIGSFAIYPNPVVSGGILFVESPMLQGDCNIEILDVSGKQVAVISDFELLSNKAIFNLSEQPTGIYFLKIASKDKSQIYKLIVY